MKKTAKRPMHARLRSIDDAQLAQVAGGQTLLTTAWTFEERTGWHEFFYAAHQACDGCDRSGYGR